MASMSKIFIIGNVGKDPELKMTGTGRPVCDFSVAVNRVTGGGQGQERQEQTDWYRVSCWGKQAETAQQIITKGRLVFVAGRFQPRQYQNRNNETAWSFDISCDDFQLLDSRRDRDGGAPPPAGAGQAQPPFDPDKVDPDEIPF
jgi:single-strand DNA-binding protein